MKALSLHQSFIWGEGGVSWESFMINMVSFVSSPHIIIIIAVLLYGEDGSVAPVC